MEQAAWDALRVIAQDTACQRPNIGATVRVVEGKRLGTVGRVTWHGPDRFSNAYRYCDPMQAQMRDILGKYGFRVRVQPDDEPPFFIGAEKVWVL